MKYHDLFVIFKKATKFEIAAAANYRWRFMGYFISILMGLWQIAWFNKDLCFRYFSFSVAVLFK